MSSVPAWVVWLIVAMGLGIAELFTLTLDLALLAVAALAATLAAGLGLPTGIQFVVFVVTAVLMLGVVRPIARRHLKYPPVMRSGVKALVGKEALVVDQVSKTTGLVKIGGEEWTARPYDSTLVIPEGASVDILAIEGATAFVHPREELWISG